MPSPDADPQPADRRGLTVPVLFAYGLPSIPFAMLGLPLYVRLPSFYVEEMGLGLAAVGVALLAARLWDVVSDPVIGALSDRLRSPWGRRKPWVVAAVPIVMGATWMLFVPGESTTVWAMLAWSVVLYTGWTLAVVPYTAWGAELSSDYHERTAISAWREGFVVIGTMLAAGIPALFLGGGAGDRAVLEVLALTVMLAAPITVAIMAWRVPDPCPARAGPALHWRRSLRLIWRNKPFLRLCIAQLLNGIANGLPATLFVLFVAHVLAAPDWRDSLLLVYFVSGVVSLPFWLAMSRFYGKHKVWVWAMIGTVAVFGTATLLGPGDVVWFIPICILTGFALGADLTLPAAVQADVIDYDRVLSRQERAGAYFAIWSMLTKLSLALGVGIAFPLLEVAGFDATPGTVNDPSSLLVLGLLYAGLPIPFKLVAIYLMWRFPIDQTRQQRLRALLDRRHAPRAPRPVPVAEEKRALP